MATKKQTGKTVQKTATKVGEKEIKEIKKTEPIEETQATKKTAVKKSAVKPVEEKPVKEGSENITETSAEEKTCTEEIAESVETAEEPKAPAFVADPKDRRPRGYAARLQVSARYSDEQAQNMLRKKIYQYKEVHLRFLRKVEETSAFSIEKLYVPVYCGKSDVRYSWKTKANKVESFHEEVCAKERRFTGANKDLDVENFLMEDLPEVMEKKRSELFETDAYNFKKTVQAFNAHIKATAPSKRANVEKSGEEYTLVYVPVMKTTCTLDGEKYVGYVNLHNGACYSDYKVSDMVERAAEKSVTAARLAKRTLWGTFLFTLTFCLLTVFSALKLADWKLGALTTESVWVSCVLAAFSLPSIALALGINAVKKDALIKDAVRTNKLPSAAWPRFASLVGVVCTFGAVILFFFKVMI